MILTRHLYNKEDVLKVLFQSIIKKNKQRAMFWAFELYYSGFGEEVFQYLLQIYEKYFEENKKKLDTTLAKMENGTAKYYSFDELDACLEEIISSYEN